MPLISIQPQDILIPRKLRLLEELASLDVESSLPPTDRVPYDRNAILEEIRRTDAELDSIGITFSYEDAVLATEATWDYENQE